MKALALVEATDHVCCRYRVRAFEPALSREGWSLALRVLHRGTAGRWLQLSRLPRVDAVVLQRKLLPSWHLKALRSRARHLVFDFDDAVLYRDSYDPRGPHCPRRARRFGETVRAADLVVAGNDFLADCALRAGALAEHVRVIPTCVAPERYEPTDEPRQGGDSGLELVWIGSSSTLQGLERTRPLWERIAGEVAGVRMRVICDRFPDLGAMPVVAVPWSQASEANDLAGADVGIATMPEGLWSRGKCGLKVLQYQAAGLPVLANPVGVHSEMIQPGVSGFLPTTDDEWVAAVKALALDAELRRRMGRAARESVETGYSVSAWEEAFVAALAGPSGGATGGSPRHRRTGHLAHPALSRGGQGSRSVGPAERAGPRAAIERNGGSPA
jgi:glycosyltransferase involved in cell wall biosynthesis